MIRCAVACVVVLAGCVESANGPVPTSAPPAEQCDADADCAAGICTRSHECADPSEVRTVQIVWTVAHHVPDPQVCANATSDEFVVEPQTDPVQGVNRILDFAPVPCELGKFTIDKLPTWFTMGGVKSREAGMWVRFDDAGEATVDLPW